MIHVVRFRAFLFLFLRSRLELKAYSLCRK
jgi:hypothetical protein